MHAVTHTLAHRAAPVSRTKARWQPYNSLQPPRSPSFLITPASSVPSSPQSARVCDIDRPVSSASLGMQSRDVQKTRYILGLVDQAVQCLCEIWQPQDIPMVFLTSSRPTVTPSSSRECLVVPPSATPQYAQPIANSYQLPSPISPPSQPSTLSPQPTLPSLSRDARILHDARSNLVPMKGFVHEVLRRSRTSSSVLQTALCYLEAIRTKVPELVREEKEGLGVKGEKDLSGRIVTPQELDADLIGQQLQSEYSVDECKPPLDAAQVDTVMDLEDSIGADSRSAVRANKIKSPSAPLQPLPPLPSPLLCPRRAFLASLILASKFTQDRCYSNRAWAKLAGLPPREIGRCERALGDALQWRLWVGKRTSSPSSPSISSGRAVVRSRSEGDLSPAPKDPPSSLSPGSIPPTRGLQRASTLPAEALANPSVSSVVPQPISALYWATQVAWSTDTSDSIPTATCSQVSLYRDYRGTSQTPPTPTLSYSPSSTESDSSGGDRTIQMSGFLDAPTSPNNCTSGFVPLGDKAAFSGASFGDMARYLPVPHIVGMDAMSNDSPQHSLEAPHGTSGVYAY